MYITGTDFIFYMQFMWAYYVNPVWWVIAHSLSPSDQYMTVKHGMHAMVHVLAGPWVVYNP